MQQIIFVHSMTELLKKVTMIKSIVILLFMLSGTNVHSQDLIKELQKLTLANDSLQKAFKLTIENSEREIKAARDSIAILEKDTSDLHKQLKVLNANYINKTKDLQTLTLAYDSLQKHLKLSTDKAIKEMHAANDSITHLRSSNKSEVSKLYDKIRKLENDTSSLNKQIKKLDISNIRNLEVRLQQKTDTISILKSTTKEKDKEIAIVKNSCLKKEAEKYLEGQQNVFNQIGEEYERSTLDNLINYSTKQSIERDFKLIGNNSEALNKLQYLQIYFTAKQLLEDHYNEQKLKISLDQLSSIDQSELVKGLKENLEMYKLRSEGLNIAITKIIELDKIFVANDDYTQKTKLQDILSELSWYFRNYRFNFIDYPYLSNIVLDIMKLKQKNANADISDLLLKL